MKTRGAIVRETPGTYEVVDLELDGPRQNELTVKMVAAGLCHSDDHTDRQRLRHLHREGRVDPLLQG